MNAPAEAGDRWATAWLMAASALVLGVGAAILDRTVASIMALVGFAFATAALLLVRSAILDALSERSVVLLLAVAIGVELLIAMAAPPIQNLLFLLGLGGVAVLAGAAAALPRLRIVTMLGASALYFACLAFLIVEMVPADIDVYMFQQEGSAALLAGRNPFELRYPNIYGTQTPFYSREVMEGAFLRFGFPYPPVSLLMALPGHLFGDYRFATAAAVALTGLLLATARPGRIGPLAAALLWLSPLAFRVVYNGWTEPFVALVAASVAFAAVRRARYVVPVVLGLLIAVKQYVFPILGLAIVLLPPLAGRRRPHIMALAVATATTIPFVALNPDAFVHSVGVVQLLQPFRLDSVSIPGMVARAGGPELPAVTAFGLLGVALLLAAWRAPRTTAGFFLAATVSFLAFFLFSKQAFMNYYFFSAALATAAVATQKPLPADRATADA